MASVSELRKKLLQIAKPDVIIDGEFLVVSALDDVRIEELVLVILKEARRPLGWRELVEVFRDYAGEDRLRKTLIRLKAKNLIAELTGARYSMPEYLRPEDFRKVKNPIILSKVRA